MRFKDKNNISIALIFLKNTLNHKLDITREKKITTKISLYKHIH